MDQTLIDQIMARVTQKIAETEGKAGGGGGKPLLLVVAQESGGQRREIPENGKLSERYDVGYVSAEGGECDVARCDTVVLCGLTVESLAKVAAGACDTPYTRLVSRALLLGKRVIVPREEVGLYQYASAASPVYYSMLEGKLKFLTASGLVICPRDELENAVLGTSPVRAAAPDSGKGGPARAAKERRLSKRVVTERDIAGLREDGVTRVHIGGKVLLTDLARDSAKAHGIEIVRD